MLFPVLLLVPRGAAMCAIAHCQAAPLTHHCVLTAQMVLIVRGSPATSQISSQLYNWCKQTTQALATLLPIL